MTQRPIPVPGRIARAAILAMAAMTILSCSPEQEEQPQQSQIEATDQPVRQEEERRPWAIMYAFGPEGEELRASATISSETVWAGRRIAIGWLVEPVVIAGSGIGMTNAAATTQYIIDTYNPKGIIFTGICGAVNPEHQIGDIVIASHWITHDFGYYGKAGLVTDSIGVGRTDTVGFDRMLTIMADTTLVRQMGISANAIAYRMKTVAKRLPEIAIRGVGVSGNAFIDSETKRRQLFNDLNADIVDMESAAVVQTAHAAGVPVVVVRSCSDLAGGAGSETASAQLKEFLEVSAHNSALVVKQFLESNWD